MLYPFRKEMFQPIRSQGAVEAVELSTEPVHEIFSNVVSATNKASDQPAHTRSLIRAFASRLSVL